MELDTTADSLAVYEALASQTRLDIINLLGEKNHLNLSEIAAALHMSNPLITRHIKKLLTAKLIRIEQHPGISGTQKIVFLNIDDVHIHFPGHVYPEFSLFSSDIQLGLYSSYEVMPTCGLASATGIIAGFDDPRYFADNNRIHAALLWFSEGFVEYTVPNPLMKNETPKILEISMELASEFQSASNHWPSDITISLNDVEIGTYTVPGNFNDVRGKLTPAWWQDGVSQYGLLKTFRVNETESSVDGKNLSSTRISDLNLRDSSVIKIKFEVKKNARYRGGLTIFGAEFGNHPQNIDLNLYYEK